MLSLPQLLDAGVAVTPARAILAPLQRAAAKYQFDTAARMAAFIGQCMVESTGFTQFEENLWYTTPQRVLDVFPNRVSSTAEAQQLVCNPKGLANCAYAGKNGNGSATSGDGWRYRARGPIGLTGRDNYRAAGEGTGRPYLDQPDLVGRAPDAMLAAGWYWDVNRLNVPADRWDIDAITRAVNGRAMRARDQRLQYSIAALSALRKGPTP